MRHSPFLPLAALLVTAPTLGRDLADLDLQVRDSDIEPTVTVRESQSRVAEEYRVNNKLYMIKITPSVGAPYYLVDEDGSGDLAWHRGGDASPPNIPQWALLSW